MGESAVVKILTTFFGTCIVYAFGGVDLILRVLLFFIVLDYVTGLMKAFKNKELSSSVGWNGLMKKIGTLIAVIVAHQMDKIDPTGSQLFRNTVVTFFIANEGVAPKGDRYDRSFLVNDNENKAYKRTEFGDFIYSSNFFIQNMKMKHEKNIFQKVFFSVLSNIFKIQK